MILLPITENHAAASSLNPVLGAGEVGARRISVPGFALELASDKCIEGNVLEGKRYFALAAGWSKEMEIGVYKHLSLFKGNSERS